MESRTRGTFLRIRVLVLFDLLSLCDLGVLSGAGVRIGSVGGTVSDKEAVGIYRFDGIGREPRMGVFVSKSAGGPSCVSEISAWLLWLFLSEFGLEFGDFLLQALDFLME